MVWPLKIRRAEEDRARKNTSKLYFFIATFLCFSLSIKALFIFAGDEKSKIQETGF